MADQLRYEDVQVGAEIPPLVKTPNLEHLVRYAAASGNYAPVHYDYPYAQSTGLPAPNVHGLFKTACLGQMLTDWAGPKAWVKELNAQYRRMDFPNETFVCKGRVTRKYVQEGEHLVEGEVWTENAAGEVTTRGTAVIRLP